jgi:predicted GNAT family acetyltransferase
MHDIAHDAAASRFFLLREGHRCELDYALTDGTMTITHTGVPEALGGRGLAGELTRVALEHAKQQGWRVVPRCSYAAVYIQRHPEYASLVA